MAKVEEEWGAGVRVPTGLEHQVVHADNKEMGKHYDKQVDQQLYLTLVYADEDTHMIFLDLDNVYFEQIGRYSKLRVSRAWRGELQKWPCGHQT